MVKEVHICDFCIRRPKENHKIAFCCEWKGDKVVWTCSSESKTKFSQIPLRMRHVWELDLHK